MVKWVQKFIEFLAKFTGKDNIKVEIAYKLKPKKRREIVDKKFLENNVVQIGYVIIHHSTTYDNAITSDWDTIDIYHRSFRMNYNIIVRPIEIVGGVNEDIVKVDPNIIKIGFSYYLKAQVEKFYEKAEDLIEKELVIGQYISTYVKNTKIETPWKKIGYTMGIERQDNKLVLRYGRNLRERQAHCYQDGMNSKSIGLLVVGDYDKNVPDGELWRFAIKVCREIKKVFPNIKFKGHREVPGVRKTCPGIKWNMDQFRKDINDNHDYILYE